MLRIPKIYLYFVKVAHKIMETPPKIPRPPLDPPDPLRIDLIIYQSIALDVRIPNM